MSKSKNQRDESKPFGRPTDYDPKYCEMLINYFKTKPYEIDHNGQKRMNDFPTLAGFAISIDVDRTTLANWAKKHKDFFCAYKRAKDYQENFLVNIAMNGLANPAFAIFTAKNVIGWRDKIDISEDEETELVFEE